ncbi:hypothetical protein EYF80_053105 [Liparis tanakae]|uniref:Uncharacterized protein n=1 Tax=Liparis tanakae TaxID=230148 RepID=A0A4Z2F763_9TELE|nr:hypothetical protein EYF80_053105 [Liparis tanakae]
MAWKAQPTAPPAAHPRYLTAGYSFRVAHSVASCSASRSITEFFSWSREHGPYVSPAPIGCHLCLDPGSANRERASDCGRGYDAALLPGAENH